MNEYDVFMRNVEGVTIRYRYEATNEDEAQTKAQQEHEELVCTDVQLVTE
jgi:hypothetical protein